MIFSYGIMIVFGLATLVQLFLWGIAFRRIDGYKKENSGIIDFKPVSILICARNEIENLRKNLPTVLDQKYSEFEVILLDDDSTDGTRQFIETIKTKYPHLIYQYLKRTDQDRPGKKRLLSQGISLAKNNFLLLTDADCMPESKNWLMQMISPMHGQTQLVLGYAPFEKTSGFLNSWIRYEGVYTAWLYLGAALWNKPYMGVGRNLVYDKKLFIEAGGFSKHQDLAGGDDDLLVNSFFDRGAAPKETAIVIDKSSWTWSPPKETWGSYFNQKTRHLGTGIRYQMKDKLLLGGLALSHFLHFLLGVFGFWFFPVLAFSGILLRYVLLFWRGRRLLKRMGASDLWPLLPIFDLCYLFYYMIFSPIIFGLHSRSKW